MRVLEKAERLREGTKKKKEKQKRGSCCLVKQYTQLVGHNHENRITEQRKQEKTASHTFTKLI